MLVSSYIQLLAITFELSPTDTLLPMYACEPIWQFLPIVAKEEEGTSATGDYIFEPSKSEIVVPIIKNGGVLAVLDVDSDQLNDFDSIDQEYLEQLVNLIANKW